MQGGRCRTGVPLRRKARVRGKSHHGTPPRTGSPCPPSGPLLPHPRAIPPATRSLPHGGALAEEGPREGEEPSRHTPTDGATLSAIRPPAPGEGDAQPTPLPADGATLSAIRPPAPSPSGDPPANLERILDAGSAAELSSPHPEASPSLAGLVRVGTVAFSQAPGSPAEATGCREGASADDDPRTLGGEQGVPGYEILGVLGRGGMGVVYKARQIRLGRLVALKTILAGSYASTEELQRFRTEAEAVARLQHPHIVQVYEVGEKPVPGGSLPYFSLEFCRGGSLEERLREHHLPPKEAAALVEKLAGAMQTAHERGIIHRDLKPANILFAEDGTPKITDFGLAKKLGEVGHTQTGTVMGTPSYMPPEQADGKIRELGTPADVYALGALLYECLSGRPPFKGATAADTIKQVISDDPVPPRRLQPGTPRDLDTIALKCLEKDPRKRYPSAGALADDLERFLRGEPIVARPVRLGERALKWTRRRPAAAALVAVSAAATLGLLLLGFWLYRAARELARSQGQEARLARKELEERRLSEDVRFKGQELILVGEQAGQRQDWLAARLALVQAEAKLSTEPALADLRERASGLLGIAEQRLAEHAKVHRIYDTFLKRRDDALYHATLFTGVDLPANLQAAQTSAAEALALYGVSPEGEGGPTLPPQLNATEQQTVRAGCYELLAILADAIAQPLPGQTPQEQRRNAHHAVSILDRAARTYPPTQAYHLRRATYLTQAGDEDGARQERQRGEARKPDTAFDYFFTGELHQRQGRLDQALRDFESALRLQPDHFWSRYFLAVCLLEMKRPAEARAHLGAALSQRGRLPLAVPAAWLRAWTARPVRRRRGGLPPGPGTRDRPAGAVRRAGQSRRRPPQAGEGPGGPPGPGGCRSPPAGSIPGPRQPRAGPPSSRTAPPRPSPGSIGPSGSPPSSPPSTACAPGCIWTATTSTTPCATSIGPSSLAVPGTCCWQRTTSSGAASFIARSATRRPWPATMRP